MNPFRWLIEPHVSGPGRPGGRPRLLVLVTFILSLGLLVSWGHLIFNIWQIRGVFELAGLALLTVVYLHICYSASTVEWFDRWIDESLRFGRRGLYVSPALVLWPGRFIAESLMDMVGLVRG